MYYKLWNEFSPFVLHEVLVNSFGVCSMLRLNGSINANKHQHHEATTLVTQRPYSNFELKQNAITLPPHSFLCTTSPRVTDTNGLRLFDCNKMDVIDMYRVNFYRSLYYRCWFRFYCKCSLPWLIYSTSCMQSLVEASAPCLFRFGFAHL